LGLDFSTIILFATEKAKWFFTVIFGLRNLWRLLADKAFLGTVVSNHRKSKKHAKDARFWKLFSLEKSELSFYWWTRQPVETSVRN
jgi:hypothetical protein